MTTNHKELCLGLRHMGSPRAERAADLIESQAARIQQQALEYVSLFDQCSQQLARIAELEKERDALNADAKRLDAMEQRLRDDLPIKIWFSGGMFCVPYVVTNTKGFGIGEAACPTLRDSIDTALQAEKETRS